MAFRQFAINEYKVYLMARNFPDDNVDPVIYLFNYLFILWRNFAIFLFVCFFLSPRQHVEGNIFWIKFSNTNPYISRNKVMKFSKKIGGFGDFFRFLSF